MADISDSTLQDLRDNREELRILAESDLRVSKYADRLLSLIEEDTSQPSPEPIKHDTNQSEAIETDSERSLMAY